MFHNVFSMYSYKATSVQPHLWNPNSLLQDILKWQLCICRFIFSYRNVIFQLCEGMISSAIYQNNLAQRRHSAFINARPSTFEHTLCPLHPSLKVNSHKFLIAMQCYITENQEVIYQVSDCLVQSWKECLFLEVPIWTCSYLDITETKYSQSVESSHFWNVQPLKSHGMKCEGQRLNRYDIRMNVKGCLMVFWFQIYHRSIGLIFFLYSIMEFMRVVDQRVYVCFL